MVLLLLLLELVPGEALTKVQLDFANSPRMAVDVSPQQNSSFADGELDVVDRPDPFKVAELDPRELAALVVTLRYLSLLSRVQNCFISP